MKEITGLMIYYYFVCERKLWYFANNMGQEADNELIKLGSLIEKDSYSREKKNILILDNICLDFVENSVVIHEVKKSKSLEEASMWQLKYYLYYLKKLGVEIFKEKLIFQP